MHKHILWLLLIPVTILAQKSQIHGVDVVRNGAVLQNPWVGGLNNPVFSEIDINQDGLKDLFMFDKAGAKSEIFLNTGTVGHPSYTYAPQYDLTFPQELHDWAVLRDFNRDGIEDIFALSGNSDIMVYKGSRNNGVLSYALLYSKLFYSYGQTVDHVWTFSDNMPIMMDVDNDGDLDILAPDIASGLNLDYYQNQAADLGMDPDSLVFILGSQCWGRFIENSADCGVTLNACLTGALGPSMQSSPAVRHQGGADYGFRYRPDQPLVSLLIADIYCNTLKFLENTGDTSDAIVTYSDSIFPVYDHSVNLPLFPAAFGVDADNDGREDLLISPFASDAYQPGQSEDIKVVQYYHNMGIDSVNKFHYLGDSMLTGGIIDVGTESHPVFFDYNGDGLMDIVMGNYGQFEPSGAPKSGLALFQNIGTDTMPKYQQITTDWFNLSNFNLNGLYPAFGDMNGDGRPDMVLGDYSGQISFFKNSGTVTNALYPSMTQQDWFSLNVGQNAAPFIYDVNGDSLPDLVIGSRNNNILYYWNYGTRTAPKFSQDSVNTFFGGVKVYNYHIGVVPGYSAPVVRMENNSLVLYSGSQLGFIFKYAIDRDSLRSGTFQLLDSNVLGVTVGLRSTVTIADINNDGQNDYLAGNIRGGFTLYSDTDWSRGLLASITPVETTPESRLSVYPNPAKDKLVCQLTNTADKLTTVHLYDVLGDVVTVPLSVSGQQMLTLTVSDLATGIYVLQAIDARGKIYQSKVAIIK